LEGRTAEPRTQRNKNFHQNEKKGTLDVLNWEEYTVTSRRLLVVGEKKWKKENGQQHRLRLSLGEGENRGSEFVPKKMPET